MSDATSKKAADLARLRGPVDEAGALLLSHRAMAVFSLASLVPLSLIFEPIGLWPLSFLCLVPWLVLVGGARYAPRVYFYSYVLALAFFLINMRWLYAATGWGYIALSVYLAVYFPFAAIALRHAVRRRRWPLAIVFPIVWTGGEMLRAVVISGFPWFFLSHSVHRVLSLIQISDLVGAYGVTFVVASVNGAIADLVIAKLALRRSLSVGMAPPRTAWSVGVAAVLVVAAIGYGQFRLRVRTDGVGPRVAVIQGDFINTVHPEDAKDHDKASDREKMLVYLSMIDTAAAQKPDLFLLPETPWIMYLNPEARDFIPELRDGFPALRARAIQHKATLVTGSASYVPTPNDLLAKERRYNSATIFSPDGAEPRRYDKVHLVPFGEFVPFRFGRLRFLYFWLNRLMPFSGPGGSYEYSIFPGEGFHGFDMVAKSQPGRRFRFAIPICYEDVMPYVSREFVCGGGNEKKVDFLLNISNDGWFGRGIQQPQHLAVCAFRAVENRVGIARAVNTGISGFIQPTGRIHDLVRGDASNPWPGACGFSVAEIGVDPRLTFYSRYGDWFAWACAALWLLVFLDYWIIRARTLAAAE